MGLHNNSGAGSGGCSCVRSVATARAPAAASAAARRAPRPFRGGGGISARRGRAGGRRGRARRRHSCSGERAAARPPPGISLRGTTASAGGAEAQAGASPASAPVDAGPPRRRRGAEDAAGVTVPAEAAPLLFPAQAPGGWRATSQARGGSSLSLEGSSPSGPEAAAGAAGWAKPGARPPPARWCCPRGCLTPPCRSATSG